MGGDIGKRRRRLQLTWRTIDSTIRVMRDQPSSDALPPPLATRWLGRLWRHLPVCGSTNDEARAWAEAGAPAGAVVTADRQTRGRGQKGRVWQSEEVKNLYYSLVLRPRYSPREAPPVTLAVGVALCDAVRRWDARATLKWPNDVLLDGKKLAGILCEARVSDGVFSHVIVGIGCNLGEQQFADELVDRATFLDAPRAAFAAALCEALERRCEQLAAGESAAILDDWRARSSIFDAPIRVQTPEGELVGRATGLGRDGALHLVDDAGVERVVVSGELV